MQKYHANLIDTHSQKHKQEMKALQKCNVLNTELAASHYEGSASVAHATMKDLPRVPVGALWPQVEGL